jgi:hypothetical protein
VTCRRLLAAALLVGLTVGACLPSTVDPASPSPSATATPLPTAAPSPSASPSAAPLADGLVRVDIPSAGIRLPVPVGWELVDEAALADEAVRADVVARYPGMGAFLEAAGKLGDRAVPALLAVDPAAAGADIALTPTVAVLVAQPTVRGPVLDFVAGFIADGLAETFGSGKPAQQRVATPVGEAVRMTFELPADGDRALAATAWVIGAEQATVLVAVIGPADEAPAADPDQLIDGAEPLPAP